MDDPAPVWWSGRMESLALFAASALLMVALLFFCLGEGLRR
jgi:hypothetical protein